MKRHIVCSMTAGLLFATHAAHADWQPTLVAAAEVRAPAADIRIQLPAEVSVETLQWLALEINNIDVSEVVRLEQSDVGFIIVVSPPQPLDPGSHSVRLVEYAPDGQILERGIFTVQTGAATGLAEKSLNIETNLRLGYRVEHSAPRRDARLDAPDDEYLGEGSSLINGRLATKDWRVDADLSLFYDSVGIGLNNEADDPRSGNELEIGEYLITRRGAVSEINLGHHAIDHTSLIMDDFNRRGASATRSTANGAVAGTVFAMRTEPVIGHRDILGVEEVDSRVMGGVVSVSPFANKRALTVSAAALSGKGNDENGVSLAGRDVLAEGDAASISAESRLFGDKLRLRGEYARTDYDFDGINGDTGKIDDSAEMLLAEFAPMQGKMLGDSPADLTFGAEYQQTGLFFRSIANSFLPPDKDLRRIYGDFQWGGLNVSVSGGKEFDNVDDVPGLPRLSARLHQLNVSYAPESRYDDAGNFVIPWYGQPSYSVGVEHARQEQTRLPAAFGSARIDRRTRIGRVSASFNYPTWNWFVGHNVGLEEDLTLETPDIRNEISDAGVNFFIAQRVYFGLQYQYNRIRESNGRISRTHLWNANIDAILIPDKLTGRLNYGTNLDRTTDNSLSTDNSVLNVELNWQVIQARANRPGMALWLRGDLQNFDDRVNSANNSSPSQVFVGLSVDWPAAFTGK